MRRHLISTLAAISFASLAIGGAAAMPVVPLARNTPPVAQSVRSVCDVYGGCWRAERRYVLVQPYFTERSYMRHDGRVPMYAYGWGGPGVGTVRLRLRPFHFD
jgi:hypothetical protein